LKTRVMTDTIHSHELRRLWRAGEEIALFDLRDEGPYSLTHPFWAVSLPLPQIEQRIFALVPRKTTPIVVYDDGEGLTERGFTRIKALGYSDVRVLEGGLAAYRRHGEVFRDVNVPSKAFGELVESIRHTPSFSADEVKKIVESEENVVVLDARRFEEYRTMSIPRGVSVPGGELVLRVHDLAPSPDTLVIVNCAGRTRSIIGTQSLVNAGLPNRVAALRNGTIGWTLAGHNVDRGQTRRFPTTSAEGHSLAKERAARWAERVGVKVIDGFTLRQYLSEQEQRTLYRLDVRTPEEYEASHVAGFINAPGGQLVQATDEWVGVRGARLVLYDDDGVRARMTASWLVQMGWDAVVVEDPALIHNASGKEAVLRPPVPDAGAYGLAAADLTALSDATILDLATSPVYANGHIPGAHFIAGARLREDIAKAPGQGLIVLTSPDGALALDNLTEVQSFTSRAVKVLVGGTDSWRGAGLPIETEPHWLSPPDDVYKRPYEGTDNAETAMQAYIDWELQLVAQLANDGVSRFHVVRD